jgi:hypothetical protein
VIGIYAPPHARHEENLFCSLWLRSKPQNSRYTFPESLYVVKWQIIPKIELSNYRYAFLSGQLKVEITHRTTAANWNTRNGFFKFTRGCFVLDEDESPRKREVVFDMNELAKVATDSVGAAQCINVRKFTDGMFNKAFLMLMDEVVAKVPNPNAGRPHYSTASEVATTGFMSVLELMSVEFGLT